MNKKKHGKSFDEMDKELTMEEFYQGLEYLVQAEREEIDIQEIKHIEKDNGQSYIKVVCSYPKGGLILKDRETKRFLIKGKIKRLLEVELHEG